MLEVVGVSAVKMAKRRNRHNNASNRKFNFTKIIEKPPARPEIEQKQGAYKLDAGIVYEVYDQQGNVTLRVPQKIDPVDEIA